MYNKLNRLHTFDSLFFVYQLFTFKLNIMKKIFGALLLVAFSMSVSVATSAAAKEYYHEQGHKISHANDLVKSFDVVAIVPAFYEVAVMDVPVVLRTTFFSADLYVASTGVTPVSRCRGPTGIRYFKCL